MRSIRLLAAGATTVVLVFCSAVAVMAQEEAEEGPSPYLFGEVEGFLHHNAENPLGCDIGFTSDTTGTGTSTLLGATTLSARNCYVPTDTYQNMTNVVMTLTGETGDVLEFEGRTGNCLPDMTTEAGGVFTCPGTVVVTGGSGAFEGASGEIHTVAYTTNAEAKQPDAVPGDAPFRMIFEGLIDY